jgi:hypothetical protein
MPTVIDALISRQDAILSYLRGQHEISLALELEANFKKLLIIACGSYFEAELINCLEMYADKNAEQRLFALIRNKALKRQYHTMFDWDEGRNANKFLSMFGMEFKESVAREIRDTEVCQKAMIDFLALGAERNVLAHGNLAALGVDKTLEEIKKMYASASHFVSFLQAKFPVSTE